MTTAIDLSGDVNPFEEPIVLGLHARPGDRYVVTEGAMKGMRGYSGRGVDGHVDGINLGGRSCERIAAA